MVCRIRIRVRICVRFFDATTKLLLENFQFLTGRVVAGACSTEGGCGGVRGLCGNIVCRHSSEMFH